MLPFFSCGRRNLPDGGYSMKKMLTIGLVMMLCAGAFGCTNMSKTQQGVASGAAIGALGGAGIATISGGSAGWGALAGGAAGALAGGIMGNSQEGRHLFYR